MNLNSEKGENSKTIRRWKGSSFLQEQGVGLWAGRKGSQRREFRGRGRDLQRRERASSRTPRTSWREPAEWGWSSPSEVDFEEGRSEVCCSKTSLSPVSTGYPTIELVLVDFELVPLCLFLSPPRRRSCSASPRSCSAGHPEAGRLPAVPACSAASPSPIRSSLCSPGPGCPPPPAPNHFKPTYQSQAL